METKDNYTSYTLNQVNNPSVNVAQRTSDRAKDILKLLNTPKKINREQLEGYCFQGIPDEFNGLRSLCWKILLNYLPNCPSKWDAALQNYHSTYENYLKEYFLPHKNLTFQPPTKYEGDPLNLSQELSKSSKLSEKRKTIDLSKKDGNNLYMPKKRISEELELNKDPLTGTSLLLKKTTSKGPTNPQTDSSLYDDIAKDTRRTRSGMEFFRKTTEFPMKSVYNKENNKAFDKETHAETLTRILFIYGKLNPNVGYVQGMNEVLAPIYYCFCNDQNPAFKGFAEADSFFCFSNLMLDLHDAFLKSFDNQGVGIQARIKTLNDLLLRIDKQVWDHLEKYSVNPQFYTLRWLMLLLTQEFEMSEVLRLWDTLLSHPKRIKYINYICLAMILQVRNKLLFTDEFAVIMEMMQRETIQHFDRILPEAFKLYKAHAKDDDLVHHIVFPI